MPKSGGCFSAPAASFSSGVRPPRSSRSICIRRSGWCWRWHSCSSARVSRSESCSRFAIRFSGSRSQPLQAWRLRPLSDSHCCTRGRTRLRLPLRSSWHSPAPSSPARSFARCARADLSAAQTAARGSGARVGLARPAGRPVRGRRVVDRRGRAHHRCPSGRPPPLSGRRSACDRRGGLRSPSGNR
jgi:hypothetical protein